MTNLGAFLLHFVWPLWIVGSKPNTGRRWTLHVSMDMLRGSYRMSPVSNPVWFGWLAKNGLPAHLLRRMTNRFIQPSRTTFIQTS